MAMNVKDFKATGHPDVDDTAALQAAFAYAIANDEALYFPTGVYNYSALALSFTGASASRGLRFYGESSGNLFGGRGSVLRCTGAGTGLTIDGNGAQAFLRADGITFEGNSSLDYGVYVSNASYVDLSSCVFCGHQKAGAVALNLFATNPGGFTGLIRVNKCGFGSNTNGVRCVGDQINVGTFSQSPFLDHTGVAIQFGDETSLMQARSWSISDCDFEGNARDIKSLCRNMSFSIRDNHFENNNPAHNTRIEIEYNGVSPSAENVIIEGNFFQKVLANAGESVIHTRSPSVRITDNYLVGGSETDRFFATVLGASQRAEVDVPAPGSDVYINRYSIGDVSTAVNCAHDIDTSPGVQP